MAGDRIHGRRGSRPPENPDPSSDDASPLADLRIQRYRMRLAQARQEGRPFERERVPYPPPKTSAKDATTAPLSAAVRTRMEPHLGDLSRVRIGTDGASAEAAAQLHARAFTHGDTVHFAPGAFTPGTPTGDALIAHELHHATTHDPGRIWRKPVPGGESARHPQVSSAHEATEQEADSVAKRVVAALHITGDALAGTGQEIIQTGLKGNARLIWVALKGLAFGTGEALAAVPSGLVKTIHELGLLFIEPKQVARDMAQLGTAISELWMHRAALSEAFLRLSPEETAYRIGHFCGGIEGLLVAAQMGNVVGKAFGSGGATGGSLQLDDQGGGLVLQLVDLRAMVQTAQTLVVVGAPAAVAIGQAGAVTDGATEAKALQLYNQRSEEESTGHLLGKGPETRGMRVVKGARAIGAEAKPKHHVFPQEMRPWFEDHGFAGKNDIDNFCVELEQATHEAIHGGGNWRLGRIWAKEWNNTIIKRLLTSELDAGRKLRFEEIKLIVEQTMEMYKIEAKYVPYR